MTTLAEFMAKVDDPRNMPWDCSDADVVFVAEDGTRHHPGRVEFQPPDEDEVRNHGTVFFHMEEE